jgi:hypothetical protein
VALSDLGFLTFWRFRKWDKSGIEQILHVTCCERCYRVRHQKEIRKCRYCLLFRNF